MSIEPPILDRAAGHRWRDQPSAWGSPHTVGASFELDRVGINSDGPLRYRSWRRAYLSLIAVGLVALIVGGLLYGYSFRPSTWWLVAGVGVALVFRARQWRRARLP